VPDPAKSEASAVRAPAGERGKVSDLEAELVMLRRERTALLRAQTIAKIGSWEMDLQTGELVWSDQMYELLGRERGLGPPSSEEFLSEIAHPDDRERLERIAVELADQEGVLVHECRLRHSDGGWRRMEVEHEPIDAALLLRAGTMRDVTSEREAQETLHTAQESFRCSFEDATIGMMTLDLEGRFVLVNEAFCAMLGYRPEELVGRPRIVVTHPDDAAADGAALRALLSREAASDTREKRYVRADGQVVWAQINLTLIHSERGEPLHFIAQVQDVSERRSYEQRLAHVANHDPLTGLGNRRNLEHELRSHVARVVRYGATGALLMLDLDQFKHFNDTHGHGAGDNLLVRVAQALRARVRNSDVLARLGGDEFAVLLPGGDEHENETVAEALVAVVRNEALPEIDETSPELIASGRRVTVSIGIARFDDGDELTAEEIMVNADLAMYAAKDAGGDRWARYRPGVGADAKTGSQVKWVEEIEHALAHDGFELLAQPVVALAGHEPAHYELLLRLRDREGRTVLPGSFLYIAERLGLVADIDRWVVERAIDMLAKQRALGRDLRFEVNLSGRTIGDEALLELIERRLREAAIEPDRLIFEITEAAAVARVARASAFADRLADLGCGFALDDFGAGIGSFYYLKHLSFDYLKIDGEFVAHCAESETDRTLITAVVQIAHGMGKHTIAEHATDDATIDVLTGLGVDYAQGFHIGRPATLTEHLTKP
jgi:diguanylate cyclase (GGDEF)-like protein/PAS domain S-box-containing protein